MKNYYFFFLLLMSSTAICQTTRYNVSGSYFLEKGNDNSNILVVFSEDTTGIQGSFYSSIIIGNYSYQEAATLQNSLPYGVTVSKVAFFDGQNSLITQSSDPTVLNNNWVGPDSSIGVSLSHQTPPSLNDVSQYYVIWYCKAGNYEFQIRVNYSTYIPPPPPFASNPASLLRNLKADAPTGVQNRIQSYSNFASKDKYRSAQKTFVVHDSVFTDQNGFFTAEIDSGVYDISALKQGYSSSHLSNYLILSSRVLPSDTLTALPPLLKLVSSKFTVQNTGVGDTTLTPVPVIAGNDWALTINSVTNSSLVFNTNPSLPVLVSANDTLNIPVTFSPNTFGDFVDTLTILSNGGNAKISLSGACPYPAALLNKSTIAFTSAIIGGTYSDSIQVTDNSINSLKLDSTYTSTKWFAASVPKNSCRQSDSVYIKVSFLPDSAGAYYDTLYVINNSQTSRIKIPLSGNVPPPFLSVPISTVNLAQVAESDSSSFHVVLHNNSINSLNVTALTTKTTAFRVTTTLPLTVHGNDSATIHVVFSPPWFGTFLDTLGIASNGGNAKVSLSGSSPYPQISLSSSAVDLGEPKVGTDSSQSLKISNSSINALIVDSVRTLTKYFTISGISFPDTLRKSDTTIVAITFTPDSVRSFSDTLYFYTNAQVSPVRIPLSGIGKTPTGITREGVNFPTVYALYQNYPNPFNPSTVIKYQIPKNSFVVIRLYDIAGREVRTLVDNEQTAGYYSVTVDASALASGVYFYRLDAGTYHNTKKLLLLK
jgi:hypothetical protein